MKAFLNITSQTHNGSYACRAHLESRSVSSGFSISTYITVHGKTPKPLVSKDPILDPMYVGETVTFTCNVNVASDWTYEWYKDKLELMGSNKTLRIHLDATGGGKYSCKATRAPRTATDVSDPVTQHVLEIPVPTLQLQTEWPDVFPTESVKMSCGVQGGPGWTYTWYRDRDVIKADGTTSSDSSGATLSINSASALHRGEYTCMAHLSGRPVSSNASLGLSLEVYEKKPDVIFTQDPEYQTMFVGESVSFSCHVNVSAGWEYHWLKNNHTLSKSSQKTLNISIIDLGSRGSYACRTGRGEAQVFYTDPSQALLLEIKENKTSPLITQQPDVDMVYAGESVSFHCEVEISSGWTYQWYKDENLLSTQASFTIDQAAVLDSGMYECVGVREKTNFQTERSRRILRVLEIPVPSLNLTSQWPDVFPTEKVMFRCGMVNASQWTYRWYLDTKEIEVSKDVSCCPEGTSLSIKSASTLHRGRYSCSGQLKSRSVQSNLSSGPTLHVYDTKPNITLMQNPEHQLMHTGDTVSFSCHVNVSSGWEYRWFKDDARLSESEQTHTIKSAVTADSGSYHCQAARGQTTAFLTDSSRALRLDIKERPSANIILLTGWSEVFSTDNLVLQCEVQEGQDKWNYTWFREGGPISLVSEKYTVTPQEDPEQGLYTCQGKQNGRPSYSKVSSPFRTKNLLLKRRVLLAIAGCIFFGIIAVVFGCIVLRFTRKPVEEDTKPEEDELFLTMAQLKDRADAPCPLVEYITDTDLNPPPKVPAEGAELPCCDTTALVTLEEEQAVTTENGGQAETSSGLMSFKK
ncbi:Fc receptor-like protein 5 [Aulostomus maculatus]